MLIRTSLAALVLAFSLPVGAAVAQATLSATFADPAWNGETVPEGQHCPLQGGTGATPALHVTGAPEGTTTINVAFNDETYEPMNDGGHGVIAFAVAPANGEVDLPSVPGNTDQGLPEGASVASTGRGDGDYASTGYMPPCSGGQGNTYSADLTAFDAGGEVVGTGTITLGKY